MSDQPATPDAPQGRPSFSIVTTLFNKAAYVAECLDSVAAQGDLDLEHVVVDDGSTDGSAAVVERFVAAGHGHVRLLRTEREGCGAALRRAVEASRGLLVGVLDADDRLLPGAVATMRRVFEDDDTLGFSWSQYVTSEGRPGHCGPLPEGSTLLDTSTFLCSHFKVFTRRAYDRTQGVDPTLRAAVDLDLMLRLEEVAPGRFVDEVLYWYREGTADQLSSDESRRQKRSLAEVRSRARQRRSRAARQAGSAPGEVATGPLDPERLRLGPVVVVVDGREARPALLHRLVRQVRVWLPETAELVLVGDAPALADRSVPSTLGALRHVAGTGAGLVLFFEADAALRGPGLTPRLRERLLAEPAVGLLGAFRYGPDDHLRATAKPWRLEVERLVESGQADTVQRAQELGYVPGDNLAPGAWVAAGGALARLGRAGLLEDEVQRPLASLPWHARLPLLVRLVGLGVGELSGAGDLLAVADRGVPAGPGGGLPDEALVVSPTRPGTPEEEARLLAAGISPDPARTVPDGEAEPVRWSVVVPVRDRSTTLDAVLHLLSQRLDEPFEVLVVDLRGGDRLDRRLPVDPRLRLLRLEGRHFQRALAVNAGLRAARGAAVVLCDGDCLVPPDYLAQLREVLGKEAKVAACVQPVESKNGRVREGTRWGLLATWSSLLLEVGGFDEGMEGWGYEEQDVLERLERRCGVERLAVWPEQVRVVHVSHGDRPRVAHAPTTDPAESFERNRARSRAALGQGRLVANQGRGWGEGAREARQVLEVGWVLDEPVGP